jgi:tetratricopeptide (TPR) repeat protein
MSRQHAMQQRNTLRASSALRPTAHAFTAALIAALLLLAGCSKNRFEITRHETVTDQFEFAQEQHQVYWRSSERMTDQKRLADIAIAAYQKVIDVFPDETTYANRSRLGIARVEDEEGHDHKALATYETLIAECPDDDVVQINAMYYAGKLLDERKEFEAAKDYYRTVVDRYSENTDKTFQQLVRASRMQYVKVRER